MSVVEIVRLVETLEEMENSKASEDNVTEETGTSYETYVRENFMLQGTVELYSVQGVGELVELVVVTDSNPYELYVELDGSRFGGNWDYWGNMSSYSNTVDAFKSSDGKWVLRLQGLYFNRFVRIYVTADVPIKVTLLMARVRPVERSRGSQRA